jgi:dihydrofolate reductase
MSRVTLVVARAANGVIGDRGNIPWRIAEDMRRFRHLTMGKPCIMGRRTWQSLPKRPLPGRSNIVVTRDPDFAAPGATVMNSLASAISHARREGADEIAIIGGSEIYRAALPFADAIELTEVHADFDGDAYFPEFENAEWREVSREEHVTADGLAYAFIALERALGDHGTARGGV